MYPLATPAASTKQACNYACARASADRACFNVLCKIHGIDAVNSRKLEQVPCRILKHAPVGVRFKAMQIRFGLD
jgi:hypothetical protein